MKRTTAFLLLVLAAQTAVAACPTHSVCMDWAAPTTRMPEPPSTIGKPLALSEIKQYHVAINGKPIATTTNLSYVHLVPRKEVLPKGSKIAVAAEDLNGLVGPAAVVLTKVETRGSRCVKGWAWTGGKTPVSYCKGWD